ncbi:MAG: helix-turn-helix domain-containing protein [Bacilli bacterium]|nr:helix-turn-helix domain-containing protein [Bacilli bacterium]
MTLVDLSDEELFRIASKGDEEAYNHLVNRLLKYAVGIMYNTLSQVQVRGYDTAEALSIADRCVLITLSRYEYGSPIRVYYRTIYLNDLCKSISRYIDEVSERSNVELDESCYDSERFSKAEYVGSEDENPQASYELNELKIILNESIKNESKFNQRQRKALLMKMQGYSISEIASNLRISSSQVRRILEKDSEGTPLQEIKIKLK